VPHEEQTRWGTVVAWQLGQVLVCGAVIARWERRCLFLALEVLLFGTAIILISDNIGVVLFSRLFAGRPASGGANS